ncbi:hypothetical protein PBAT_07885 [Paenibacillus antarcticus]|uniref:Uncharacterized protein n=2 Tax=Paenibacillus antarcticus TaxID=253703 RepID=A0A168PZA0_9BACL|nr:hypothetical protein PBAT_07885 [Paenibacillus antarcticus]
MNQVRVRSNLVFTIQQKLLRVLFVFSFGLILGFVAKYADTVSINADSKTILRFYTYGLSIIRDITTSLGIWVLIGTLLAARSRSPKAAALYVFIFFVGMLVAYYSYSSVLFGFFPKYYFFAWGVFALLSPICAYIIWYAGGNGWIAAFCSAPPIALLLINGDGFYYTHSLLQDFDLFLAILLFIVLPSNNMQRLRVLPFVVIMYFLCREYNLISMFFGGL